MILIQIILVIVALILIFDEGIRTIVYYTIKDAWKITKYRRIMKLCIIFLLATLIF